MQAVGTKLTLYRGKLEARRAEQGCGSWEGAVYKHLPSSYAGDFGERFQWAECGPERSPGRNEFWCTLVSSGELSCNPAMQNCV